ncbi:hypothetical protein DZF91_09980 [Actinomadura logoneensis]|uniref:Uncharacterized protein n=1 Tax=Actinomadura logoneensis TaxID=2293572 RepID=A0A372JPB0_9ACTN|nr:hypothetical protein [Actinomadura logoneensis]RFU41800.1 hypothetical protein DZF91_09980 [Actinomadura logoneensis]
MDDLVLLRREFDAEEGTFLGGLRPDLVWDKAAFSRLEQAMRRVCAAFAGRDELPRWLVEGFWFCADWVPSWTGHADFPRPEPLEYYEGAVERLRDLQSWFVTGESPYLEHHEWPAI